MDPYMKKNHMARGQNFLPLPKVIFKASVIGILAEVDSLMGSPVSSEMISSMAGSPMSFGWSLTIIQHMAAIIRVMTPRAVKTPFIPRASVISTRGVVAARAPTLPTSSNVPLRDANSYFLNHIASTFIMGM